jgi:hypothetical protein
MKSRILNCVAVAFVAAIGTVSSVRGAALVTYDFENITGSNVAPVIPPSTTTPPDSSVTATNITVNSSASVTAIKNTGFTFGGGSGVLSMFPGGGLGDTSVGNTATAAAVDSVLKGYYVSFTVTPNSGVLNLTSLTFAGVKGGGSDPRGIAIQSSATGFSTDGSTNLVIGTGASPAGGTTSDDAFLAFTLGRTSATGTPINLA